MTKNVKDTKKLLKEFLYNGTLHHSRKYIYDELMEMIEIVSEWERYIIEWKRSGLAYGR